MAYLQVTYFAEPLLRSTTFSLILPNDGMKMSIEGNKNYEIMANNGRTADNFQSENSGRMG